MRIYPDAEQVEALVARGRVRAILWNWCCDVFERTRAQAKGNDAHGLAIQCTRAALSAEVERIRRKPSYEWLRKTLPLWSCLQIVKQACAGRRRAFEHGGGHPQGRGFRASAPLSFCVAYDGRTSDKHYAADKGVHIPAVGVLKVRTGHGHMPKTMVRNPTVTVRRDACARWWLSFCVEAPGGTARWRGEKDTTPAVPDNPDTVVGLDVGARNWIVTSDGHRWESPAQKREREGTERRRRNTRHGRRKAVAKGEDAGRCPKRRSARKAKQQRLSRDYAPDGWIGRLRAAAKAEKAARRARAREHAALARAEKVKAETEAKAELGGPAKDKDRGGRGPHRKPRKTRKVRHKGKGSGARRRRARAKSTDESRERCLQKRLSRRTRGSKRYEQGRYALAVHCAHVADHRADCVHKASGTLVAGNTPLGVETLDIAGMVRGWGGKHILRAALGALLHCIDYKALWYDTPVRRCPLDYPSSMRCSACGEVNRALKLSQHTWTCPGCETHHDRDENAAANIADYAANAWAYERNNTSTTRTPRPGGTTTVNTVQTPAERHERRGGDVHTPARRASPGSGNDENPHPACTEQEG